MNTCIWFITVAKLTPVMVRIVPPSVEPVRGDTPVILNS